MTEGAGNGWQPGSRFIIEKLKIYILSAGLPLMSESLDFMMKTEKRFDRIREFYRNRARLECEPNDEEMHKFMLTTFNECGFSSETYFQVSGLYL